MTSEEIMHALRLTAMGRIGAPEQQRLCEMLQDMREAQERFEAALCAPPPDTAEPLKGLEPLIAKRTRKAKAD